MNWKTWIHSAVVSILSAVIGAVLQYLQNGTMLPQTPAQWHTFEGTVAGAALLSIAALLKQSPLTPTPPKADNSGGNVNKIAGILICIIALGATALAQTATPTQPPAVPTSLFSASSEATALNYASKWSVANHTTESFDLLDFGAGKASHLMIEGHEISAPTPGFGSYLGGVRVAPNISKILAKTNLPASNFGIYFQGAAGVAQLSKTSTFSFLAAGGLNYRLSSSLSWSTLHAGWVRVGAQNAYEISTGLTAFFGSH